MADAPDTAPQRQTETLPPVTILGRAVAYRHYALAILTLIYILNYMDRQILAVLLQPIKNEFGVSDSLLGLLSGFSFALFYATLGIPIAMLADRMNRRNIIAISLGIFSLMTVLCGLAAQFWQLMAARIGVGIGEAGTSPPSHSIIADLYPPEKRSTALAIFATGVNIGLMFGFFGAGWINEVYGWRTAFLAAGLPGVLLAAFVFLGLREPQRGLSDGQSAFGSAAPSSGEPAPIARPERPAPPEISSVITTLWRIPSFRHLAFGAALNAFVGYGAVSWTPAFLIRSHGLSTTEIGIILALMYGLVGLAGTALGGYWADRFSVRDRRWQMWVPAWTIIASAPFGVGFYLSESTMVALAFYVVPVFVGSIYLGPSFSATQALSPIAMRSAASAILLFIINIIGLGFGPLLLGILSDLLRPSLAEESLRWAMVLVGLVNIWSGIHFLLAARTLREDLDRAGSG